MKVRSKKRKLTRGAMRWLYQHLIYAKSWGANARMQSDVGHKVVVYWWFEDEK